MSDNLYDKIVWSVYKKFWKMSRTARYRDKIKIQSLLFNPIKPVMICSYLEAEALSQR